MCNHYKLTVPHPQLDWEFHKHRRGFQYNVAHLQDIRSKNNISLLVMFV
jgi:hypothetical protein